LLIGIDVGGTFTDGVLFDGQNIVKSTKHATRQQDLKTSLWAVLDDLLLGVGVESLKRIVLSTTLVTNIIATGQGDRVASLLLPGPGLPFSAYDIFPDTYFLAGAIDFRGREIQSVNTNELRAVLSGIERKGIEKIAVVGKFSNRNNIHERQIRDFILSQYPHLQVALGSTVAGQLNFFRRMVTTYYSVMTQDAWNAFLDDLDTALSSRNITSPVEILKADGGTMSLQAARHRPCETVFSGPAASTMGAWALKRSDKNSVVLDIGGTTTDISLLIEGQPLYASKGARINGQYTHIKAFSVRSVALGGDSPLLTEGQVVTPGKTRLGPAACFNGPRATVTDLFNHMYSLGIGNAEISSQAMQSLAAEVKTDAARLCEDLQAYILDSLQREIAHMFTEWENEPAYRVWEVVHGRKFKLDEIIGIGAAAHAIVPALAAKMNVDCTIVPFAPVANALGACVARPTLALDLHIDTQQNSYTSDQEGITGKLDSPGAFKIDQARRLAEKLLFDLAQQRGMAEYAEDAEIVREEQFNIIRGWSTSGRIFEIGIQVAPGFIKEYQGVSK